MYDLFGQSTVPPEAAEVIEHAVSKAIERGDVSPNAAWQLVEFWAADYLAGVETDRQHQLQGAVDRANQQLPTGGTRSVRRRTI
jgi:hypothetical protein